MYATIDEDIEEKNKIPLTTNESYGTASSRALEMESEMYDYVNGGSLKKDDIPLTANASYETTSRALETPTVYAFVNDDALKKSNFPLTVNPSYGTTKT